MTVNEVKILKNYLKDINFDRNLEGSFHEHASHITPSLNWIEDLFNAFKNSKKAYIDSCNDI